MYIEMNIQQLRESLKIKWVKYYHQNRSWLEKMRIWGTYDDYRRPSSGFILATLSVLEPKLDEIFPFILELNNNPDEIISALGLNFNPEEHLHLVDNLEKPINNHQANNNLVEKEIVIDKFRAEKREDTESNKPKLSDATAITKIEKFPFPAQLESEDELLSLLSMCDEDESQEIVEPTEEETEEIKKASRKKASKLASWIDEFCQGTGWDREEAIFIPF